jgi:hypothetical protein
LARTSFFAEDLVTNERRAKSANTPTLHGGKPGALRDVFRHRRDLSEEASMRPTLSRIVIAVDNRSSSDAAIEQGLALAVEGDAEVVFVQVVSAAGGQSGPKAPET